MKISPPRPPSPPLGPPLGTYFSRRKAMQPLPPSPALRRIFTSSMNTRYAEKFKRPRPGSRRVSRAGGLSYFDADELAHAAAIAELDHAGDFGEQGIVFAPADILAGLQAGAALADDDRPAGDQLAAENFDAQALCIRIAPVLGTA